MNRSRAASLFSAFLFVQGVIGFAALATVVLRDAPPLPTVQLVAAESGVVIR